MVQADRWDGPLVALPSVSDAAACPREHGLGEEAAAGTAATLDLPLTLAKRGRVGYATKGS